MYKNLLVATDGSKLSDKAVAHAIGLAQAVGASLTAFYAAPDYPMPAYADGVVGLDRRGRSVLSSRAARSAIRPSRAMGSDPGRRQEEQV